MSPAVDSAPAPRTARLHRGLGRMWCRLGRVLLVVALASALLGGVASTAVSLAPPPVAQPRVVAGPSVNYGWPLPAPHPVVRAFDPPESPYGPGHRGVDLGGGDGVAVFAAADGTVAFAGPVAGIGVVSIQHADGLRSTYEPVQAMVRRGQSVRRGQRIGTLRPGHPCGAAAGVVCLHWGVRRGRDYLDPLGLVDAGRVRLLPWRDPDRG